LPCDLLDEVQLTTFLEQVSLSLQGVQAQTVANFYLAFELDLPIIPVLNKIDLKVAQPDVVLKQLKNLFDIEAEDVIKVRYTCSLKIYPESPSVWWMILSRNICRESLCLLGDAL